MGSLKSKLKALVMVAGVVVALLAVVYRVYLVMHRAVPADLAEVEKIRWLDEMGRIARYGSQLLQYFGIEPGIEPLKLFINTAFSILVSPLPWQRVRYRDVRVSQDVYAGVPVSTYTPVHPQSDTDGYPTIIYFHGGGWTWLSVGVYDGPLKHLANYTKFKVIAVEYRKSPQHPFPAAYEDSLAVTRYVINNARDLNICKDLIVVAGDGAGGNLAAAVANEMASLIRLQVLINPALQMLNFATPSYQEHVDNAIPGITSTEKTVSSWMRYAHVHADVKPAMLDNLHVSLRHYSFLSNFVDSRRRLPAYLNVTDKHTIHNSACREEVSSVLDQYVLDSRFNPMFAPDVRNVADAYIITAQYDVLRDEGLMYGHRLQENGVDVELQHYKNGFHGFFLFAGGGWIEFAESQRAMEDLVSYLHTEVLDLPLSDI
ncbi:neutral cholesterol ester hydrolase 1 [Aplysia californica]|uniref:Neutral cholesterol ester hydrolase 1 n=1 Tax=Aplysia californica TaxID=6500 RepID=A0ABM1A6H4_APLCA|nr:neutral cholesterol ester hydrolase 1 [Aplysia californica]